MNPSLLRRAGSREARAGNGAEIRRSGLAVRWACVLMAVAGADAWGAADQARIQIQQSGLYRVAAADLAACLGSTPAEMGDRIAGAGLRLTSQGQDIPWFASDDGSNLCFYGEGFESIYTGINVYWIEEGAGLRMTVRDAVADSAAPSGQTFAATAHFEENKVFAGGILRDPLQDFWVWSSMNINGNTRLALTFTARVDRVSAAFGATLKVRLVSKPDTTNSPDHHVYLYLNGTNGAESAWDGLGRHEVVMSCDPGLLVSGANGVRLEGVRPPGVAASLVAVDSFDLLYRRDYVAVSNRLSFASETYERITVDGFAGTNVFILDVTDPKRPVRLNGTRSEATGPSCSVSLTPGGPNRWLYACGEAALDTPSSLQPRMPATLRAATNAADFLVIAPPALWTEAGEWAAYRQSQGLQAIQVALSDIYDEFNHGISDPAAIRDFLAWAHRKWARAPRYVLLAGNGTYDFRNYLGKGDNLVPPLLIEVGDELGGLMGTDALFADVDDDGAPEFAVGRLPATNGAALRGMLRKVQQYERPESRTNAVLFVADHPDQGGTFHADTESIAARVPADQPVVKAYLTNATDTTWVKSRMTATLNGGCRMFTFVGHGSIIWLAADPPILSETEARALTNRACPPFLVAACCAVSQFDRPNAESLCESMVLNTNGGAVATWGAINATLNSENVWLADALHQGLYSLGMARYGDAIGHALTGYAAAARPYDTARQYNLLGDPATAFDGTNGLPAMNPFGADAPAGYDEWCRLQFSALERSRGVAAAAADPDGDGFDNAAECGAGSDARSAASPLRVTEVAVEGAGGAPADAVRLAWPSAADVTYGIEYSTNLSAGFHPYTNDVPGWPPVNVHTCRVDGAGTVFFRVTVQ